MIHGVEKGDGFPLSRRGVALHTHLQTQHQVQMRQPGLAGSFTGQPNARTPFAYVRFKGAESLHPVRASARRMFMIGSITDQTRAGLVHIDAAHAKFIEYRIAQVRIGIAPERRAHAHRGVRRFRKGVVDFGTHCAVWSFDRETFRVFPSPALGGHAPQTLVHVYNRVNAFGARVSDGVAEVVGALTRREILGEADIIGAAVPPVPEHADRHSQIVPHFHCRRQHAGRWSTIPHPEACIRDPGGRSALFEAAVAGPGLLKRPTPVDIRHGDPVAIEQT